MTRVRPFRLAPLALALFSLPVLAGAGLTAGNARAQTAPLVVLELFTSQGCNSCPPADALMPDWMREPGVLPISLHVDYWDYLGWKDTFGRKGHGVRQKDYAHNAGSRQIYTPQVVVNGRFAAIGSNRDAVDTAILKARKQQAVALKAERGKLRVAALPGFSGEAKLLLCRFDLRHDVTIERGENHGRTLSYHNVAKSWTEIGRWTGQAATFDLPDLGSPDWSREGAVVMLQTLNGTAVGPIIGAVTLRPAP